MSGEVDLSVTPVAERLLECLRLALADDDNPPLLYSLRPGLNVDLLLSTTRDECCEGLAWVRVTQIYPSSEFPLPDETYSRCGPVAWAAILEMGVARCTHTPDAESIPTDEEWTAISRAILNDAAAMRRAVCCFKAADPDRMCLAGPWQPVPVEGSCVGGAQTVTVAIGACDCA